MSFGTILELPSFSLEFERFASLGISLWASPKSKGASPVLLLSYRSISFSLRSLSSMLALITGIDAVEMAFRSVITSHSFRYSANVSSESIIFYLSGKKRFVTAISISLDSRASPVIRDPNYMIFGFELSLWVSSPSFYS